MALAGDVAPGPVTVARRGRRKKIAVVLLAIAVIGGSWFTWDSFIRPRTIREVLEGGPYQPGAEVRVAGTITGIHREETSYGPIVALELADPSWLPFWEQPLRTCERGSVRGDPTTPYNIGDRFETVLHFDSYRLNGDSAVWAPELVCPFPTLHRSIGVVLDASSQTAGMLLAYNGSDPDGWSRYEISTQNSSNPGVLPVVLLKALPAGNTIDSAKRWTEASERFYLMASAALGPDASGSSVADQMTSLAALTSANRSLRFVDVDANGLVYLGDRLDVHFPPTGSSNGWDAYILRIGNWSAGAPADVRGVHVILVGPTGPMEILLGDP
jgi:hypothetical protein